MKHLYDNLNCIIHNFTTPGPHGQLWKKKQVSKIFSTFTLRKRTKCTVMMSMKPSIKIVKFMHPWARGLGPKMWQIQPYRKNILNLNKISTPVYNIWKKKINLMVIMVIWYTSILWGVHFVKLYNKIMCKFLPRVLESLLRI